MKTPEMLLLAETSKGDHPFVAVGFDPQGLPILDSWTREEAAERIRVNRPEVLVTVSSEGDGLELAHSLIRVSDAAGVVIVALRAAAGPFDPFKVYESVVQLVQALSEGHGTPSVPARTMEAVA